MHRKSEPKPVDRGPVDMGEMNALAGALLRTPEKKTPSENRELTRVELEQKWALRRHSK